MLRRTGLGLDLRRTLLHEDPDTRRTVQLEGVENFGQRWSIRYDTLHHRDGQPLPCDKSSSLAFKKVAWLYCISSLFTCRSNVERLEDDFRCIGELSRVETTLVRHLLAGEFYVYVPISCVQLKKSFTYAEMVSKTARYSHPSG